MRDGAPIQGSDPRQQQVPGTPPAPEPKQLPDPNGDLPPLKPDSAKPDDSVQNESEAVAYWRTQAMKARTDAEKYRAYKGIIEHLETNPQTVDALERMILGQAVNIAVDGNANDGDTGDADPEKQIMRDLGFDDSDTKGDENMARNQQAQSQDQRKLRDDELQRIRAEERARLEFERFMAEMREGGVPDHAIDEFVNFLNNPNGLTFHDLFVAYNANRARSGKDPIEFGNKEKVKSSQNPQETAGAAPGEAPPMTVGQMPGDTDRPMEVNQSSGDVYLHKTSPNDL